MESNFGKCNTGSCHTYEHIEIVEIDGKKRVKRKRDGKIMHANKEALDCMLVVGLVDLVRLKL